MLCIAMRPNYVSKLVGVTSSDFFLVLSRSSFS